MLELLFCLMLTGVYLDLLYISIGKDKDAWGHWKL